MLDEQLEQQKDRKLTLAEKHEKEIIDKLSELGGARARDTSIKFGQGFTLPTEYKDNLEGAVSFLADYVEAQESVQEFSRTFMRRPWDGAVCMVNAMQKHFGTIGKQRGISGFFFSQPPEMRTISVGPRGETTQVPWGLMEFPLFKGTIMCDSVGHRTYGPLFHVMVRAAKKYGPQIEGFFRLIEEECSTNSIYQGKVIDGQDDPEFIDPYTVDKEKIIFSEDTRTQLQANLWSPLRYSDTYRGLNIGLNRKVLIKGEFGVGKTLATARTMQVATENGWTAMTCRPGRDNLDRVMQTARLYQPCVIVIEDIDTVASSADPAEVSRLLDLFDGVQAKGVEVVGVLTTNHIENIHKAMLRPGRLDAVIELGDLDLQGVQRMVETMVDSGIQLGDIDYHRVFESMEKYPPAFVKEAIDRAIRYAVDRAGGNVPDSIDTDDLVEAAEGLRPQYNQMSDANEGKERDSLGTAFEAHVTRAMTNGVGVSSGRHSQKVTPEGELAAPIVPVVE